jgi:hypothetical protein
MISLLIHSLKFLQELISTLQKIANDPYVDSNKAGFGSYIADHAIREKKERYKRVHNPT